MPVTDGRRSGGADSGVGVGLFDHGELIEVENHELAIIALELEPVQPETVVLGMGEPGTGLRLTVPLDLTLDGIGPGLVMTVRDLMGHSNSSTGCEGWKFDAHGFEYTVVDSSKSGEGSSRPDGDQNRIRKPVTTHSVPDDVFDLFVSQIVDLGGEHPERSWLATLMLIQCERERAS